MPVVQGEGANAGEFLPIIHTLFGNIKAWLVGTHHGVSAKHLPRHLREWSYRFNRRNLPDGLDGYLIRRTIECATITFDQPHPRSHAGRRRSHPPPSGMSLSTEQKSLSRLMQTNAARHSFD
jgi:ISXO2-like transposase domain